MTICSSKANSDLPDPAQDDASFTDLICNQIHALMSQQHQHGTPGPERMCSHLWHPAGAVKHIAEQYAVDDLSHSLPAAGHADDSVFFERSLVSSNPATFGDQENAEPGTPFFDLFASSPPAYYTDDNNRWLSEHISDNFSLSNIPSAATEPSVILSRDGTCKPSDLMPPPDLSYLRSSTYSSNAANRLPSDQWGPRSPTRDGAEEEREKEEAWTKEKNTISIRLKQTASTFLSKQTKSPRLWVAAPFLAFGFVFPRY